MRSLLFYCTADGLPEATVEWFKGNESVNGPQLYKQMVIIYPETPHDTIYTCVAKNKVGSTHESFAVQGMYACM